MIPSDDRDIRALLTRELEAETLTAGSADAVMHRGRRIRRRTVVATSILSVVLVGSLAGLTYVAASMNPSSDVNVSSDGTVSPVPAPSPLGDGIQPLPAGTYVLDLDADRPGEDRFPTITMTVPDGWKNIDGWGVNTGEFSDHWMGITFWEVDEVYAHPCRWQRRMIEPGPTVADLANVLADRPLRAATKPVDITVDGFQGKQLKWSVPANIDFSECDAGEFRSWMGATRLSLSGPRYHQGPGQVDLLWIVDVDGNRLVVDAMYMPSTNAEDRAELRQVMESIRFET